MKKKIYQSKFLECPANVQDAEVKDYMEGYNICRKKSDRISERDAYSCIRQNNEIISWEISKSGKIIILNIK